MKSFSQIEDLSPVPWVRERDIDLLLAQLFVDDHELVRLFAESGLAKERVPSRPLAVESTVNYSRPDAVAAATGETDVIVAASYAKGQSLLISIEDKVWAAPQLLQGRRHRSFVEASDATWRLAVLVAPRAWIESHPVETTDYHCSLSLETLSKWCRGRGHNFHADVFAQACTPRGVAPAPDLQDWFEASRHVLREQLDIDLEPQRFVRTTNVGSAKPNRWISCARPTLRCPPESRQPWLTLKPRSSKHPARAVIEIPKASEALVECTSIEAEPTPFRPRMTRAGTLLIEYAVPAAADWSVGAGFNEQVPHLIEMGRAAGELRVWWNERVVPSLAGA